MMKPETATLIADFRTPMESCCPIKTADAFNAWGDLIEDANMEASAYRRRIREARSVEPTLLGAAFSEANEKLKALDGRRRKAESAVDAYMQTLVEFTEAKERIMDHVQATSDRIDAGDVEVVAEPEPEPVTGGRELVNPPGESPA